MDSVWGRATVPGDYADLEPLSWYSGTPGLLGSQRTGPDLSNVGVRQPSEEWHLIHLYNPRLVVADSIMPAMPWLFRVKGKPRADELWLQLPTGSGESSRRVIATTRARELVSYLLQLGTEGPDAPATPGSTGPAPMADDEMLGKQLYHQNCASCHQANGQGLPGVFPPLPVLRALKLLTQVPTSAQSCLAFRGWKSVVSNTRRQCLLLRGVSATKR